MEEAEHKFVIEFIPQVNISEKAIAGNRKKMLGLIKQPESLLTVHV
ncbi:MAG: hypothetical protein KJ915_05950 [Candidatus Omnitrophica bacterium]|nr:hypothetical protein [Candidatus Omnitrophota bacterium]